MGEPARIVRARGDGRHLQERTHPIDIQLGILTQRPAHRARHRREQPVRAALGARLVSQYQRRALAADRHAVRSLHRARTRCAQLRLLPGCALHSGRDAVRHHAGGRRRRAPIHRRAVDRAGARRPGGVAILLDIGDAAPSERNWLRDETGGSVYLRLSTRPVEQIERTMTAELAQQIVDGAYWLRKPGPNAQVVVAYTGAIAPEAIAAVGLMAEDRRDVGLLAVTSADRLNAGWTAAQRARAAWCMRARISSGYWRTCRIIAASSACSTDTRRRWPGSARFPATARARSASSISARPARSPSSTGTTASTPTPSSRPRRRSRLAGRSGI